MENLCILIIFIFVFVTQILTGIDLIKIYVNETNKNIKNYFSAAWLSYLYISVPIYIMYFLGLHFLFHNATMLFVNIFVFIIPGLILLRFLNKKIEEEMKQIDFNIEQESMRKQNQRQNAILKNSQK